jgi:hypothetical protein
MEYEKAKTLLINIEERFEKQWTKNEKEAFNTALVMIDLRIKENERRIAELKKKA